MPEIPRLSALPILTCLQVSRLSCWITDSTFCLLSFNGTLLSHLIHSLHVR